jgi:hypothetical protein
VLFTRSKPVFGAIIEAQLRPKKDKLFTWPLYAVGARAREKCPFVVLVIAPNLRRRGGPFGRSSWVAGTSTPRWSSGLTAFRS